MANVLFCVPLKKGCLKQYQAFAKETIEKEKEYRDLMARYDIHCTKVWHKNINDCDYIFVYHEVGPNFEEKMKNWETSEHSFDQWFNASMMAVCDFENAHSLEQPTQLIDF